MRGKSYEFSRRTIDAAKSGTRVLIAAPGAGKQLLIFGLKTVASAIGTVRFRDSTPASKTGLIAVAANQEVAFEPFSTFEPWFVCAENTAFEVTLSADTNLDGVVLYAVDEGYAHAMDIGTSTSPSP